MTLKQLCDKLEIHPYDLVGDDELADDLWNEDIEDTIFYQDLISDCNGKHNTTDDLFQCVSCSILFIGKEV